MLPEKVSVSPGKTPSFQRTRVLRTRSGPIHSAAQLQSIPAWNMPMPSGAG